MRWFSSLVLFLGLSSGFAQTPVDPFAELDAGPVDPFAPPDPNAPDVPPKYILVLYELIEIDRAEWNRWSSNPENSLLGPEIRDHVQQLLEKGEATIAWMGIVPAKSGQRAKTASADEMIHPAHYELSSTPPPSPDSEHYQRYLELEKQLRASRDYFIGAFETRNVGFTFEIDPVIGGDGKTIDMNLNPEVVSVSKLETARREVGDYEFPIFSTQRVTHSITAFHGVPSLIGTFRPHKSVDDSREDPVSLAFVTAELHSLKPLPENVENPPPKPMMQSGLRKVVLFEWVELEHADLHQQLLGAEPENLREIVQKLLNAGRAEMIEAHPQPFKYGQRVKLESIEEFVYPTEFDAAEFDEETGEMLAKAHGVAFETRNLGFTSEFDGWPRENGWEIETQLNPERVELRGMRPWGADFLEVKTPDIATLRFTGTAIVPVGQSRLLSTHRPQSPEKSERDDPRIALFARIEANEHEKSDEPARPQEKPDAEQLLIAVEVYETTQPELNRLLRSPEITMGGLELHAAVSEAARSVETVLLTGLSGKRCQTESILELMYPSEYDPPEPIEGTGGLTPPNGAAYETRHVGQTFEFDPTVTAGGRIDFNLNVEAVTLNKMTEFFEGTPKIAFPEFRHQRITTSITVDDGVPTLLGTTRPENSGQRILVWFLRATAWP